MKTFCLRSLFLLVFSVTVHVVCAATNDVFNYGGLRFRITDETNSRVELYGYNYTEEFRFASLYLASLQPYNQNTKKYYKITSIKDGALRGCTKLTTVYIDGVSTISKEAF